MFVEVEIVGWCLFEGLYWLWRMWVWGCCWGWRILCDCGFGFLLCWVVVIDGDCKVWVVFVVWWDLIGYWGSFDWGIDCWSVFFFGWGLFVFWMWGVGRG